MKKSVDEQSNYTKKQEMLEFGEKLRECRERKKFNKEKLGNLIHKDRNTVSSYENGVTLPDINTMNLILDVFEKDYHFFFPNRGKKEKLNPMWTNLIFMIRHKYPRKEDEIIAAIKSWINLFAK